MALHAAALAELDGRRGGPALRTALPSRSDLEASLGADPSGDDRAALVGLLGNESVALATVRLDRASEAAGSRPAGVLELLYVAPAARRQRVAGALIGLATRWAAENGCARLDALALPGDRGLKSFFEAAGLRARLLVMSRPLGEPTAPDSA